MGGDNLDVVWGFSAGRAELHLGQLYRWARALANQYCPARGLV